MRSALVLVTLVAVALLSLPPTALAEAGAIQCVTILTSANASGTAPILSVAADQIVVGAQEDAVGQEAVAIVLAPGLCTGHVLALP